MCRDHSYLNASTGGSCAARRAGYTADRIPTMTSVPKASAAVQRVMGSPANMVGKGSCADRRAHHPGKRHTHRAADERQEQRLEEELGQDPHRAWRPRPS